MRRRDLLAGLGGAVAGWPWAAHGQRSGMPLVGFLSSRSPGESAQLIDAFLQGLHEAGYVEGRNVQVAFHWAGGIYERLAPLARSLVGRQAAVIVAAGDPVSATAAMAATPSTPIVFTAIDDPVGTGLVTALDRPGGNVTGVSLSIDTLGPKRLACLHALVPTARLIALLVNPDVPQALSCVRDLEVAAASVGQEVVVVEAGTDGDLDAAFAALIRQGAHALIVQPGPFFDSRRHRLAALAGRHEVPAIYGHRDYAKAGGLMSYGPSMADNYRKAGVYTGRILKGERPADLSILRPTKFELVINLTTARRLGIDIPPALLASADDVLDEAVQPRPSSNQADREGSFLPP